ncbi:sigma-70 family RNA polymerase sigma factor [Pontibacillus yanchengensis]|uniref:Sigma-70 family RNA polymerase sigma factor n=2 Tax=Pontibacillus yanchengensis TaxID=462910 RepID=A0A6I4ZZI0_9BACI|nr:sigma-70 family RNA polymerase sigma factor [Pontibacillus yanchengensis]
MENMMERLRQRDEEALQYIMNRYGNELIRSAYLMVKDQQLAEEIVQDGFVKVFDKIHQLQDESKLKSWLMTIVLNQCRSKIRTKRFRFPFLPFDPSERDVEAGEDDSPEELVVQMQKSESLVEHIHNLDHHYREVIILFYYHDYSLEKMVEITNVKKSTIKSRLRRARMQLRDRLEKGETIDEAK